MFVYYFRLNKENMLSSNKYRKRLEFVSRIEIFARETVKSFNKKCLCHAENTEYVAKARAFNSITYRINKNQWPCECIPYLLPQIFVNLVWNPNQLWIQNKNPTDWTWMLNKEESVDWSSLKKSFIYVRNKM